MTHSGYQFPLISAVPIVAAKYVFYQESGKSFVSESELKFCCAKRGWRRMAYSDERSVMTVAACHSERLVGTAVRLVFYLMPRIS